MIDNLEDKTRSYIEKFKTLILKLICKINICEKSKLSIVVDIFNLKNHFN